MLIKLEWLGYRTVKKKLWPYVKPFSSDTGTLRTDGRTDGQTDLLYQYRASVCWRAIKTVESAEYTCQSQQCNRTNSAAILQMEIKHVAAYYFLKTIMWRVDLRDLYAKVHETWHYVYSNHLCLTSFFQNYNILPRSGVRAESLRVRSKNTPNFVTFWHTL